MSRLNQCLRSTLYIAASSLGCLDRCRSGTFYVAALRCRALIGKMSPYIPFAHSCEAVAGAGAALLVSRHSVVVPWSVLEKHALCRSLVGNMKRDSTRGRKPEASLSDKLTKNYLTRRYETRRRGAASIGMPESVASGKSTETAECKARAARRLSCRRREIFWRKRQPARK